MKHTLRWATPVLALSLAPLLAANAAPPEPGPAASGVPSTQSAFADYKPWREIKLGDWRALNAESGGGPMAGMAGHEMGSSDHSMAAMPGMSGASAPAARAAASSASASPHSGHSMHGGHR